MPYLLFNDFISNFVHKISTKSEDHHATVISDRYKCITQSLIHCFCHKNCKYDVVSSVIPSLEKCAVCNGPYSALRWISIRFSRYFFVCILWSNLDRFSGWNTFYISHKVWHKEQPRKQALIKTHYATLNIKEWSQWDPCS